MSLPRTLFPFLSNPQIPQFKTFPFFICCWGFWAFCQKWQEVEKNKEEKDEEISLVSLQLFAWSHPVARVGKGTRHQVAFHLFLFFVIRKVHLASPQTAPCNGNNGKPSVFSFVVCLGKWLPGEAKEPPSRLLKRSSRCRKINSSFYSTNIFGRIHKLNYQYVERKWDDQNEVLF